VSRHLPDRTRLEVQALHAAGRTGEAVKIVKAALQCSMFEAIDVAAGIIRSEPAHAVVERLKAFVAQHGEAPLNEQARAALVALMPPEST